VLEHYHNYYSNAPDGCLHALRNCDPYEEKFRIEINKDALLKQCCSWILNNEEFLRWRHFDQSRLLWINGNPGKGKTMMMIALVEELEKMSNPGSLLAIDGQIFSKPYLVSYFFCQSTDPRLNNATSVLKGLIYLLAKRNKSLIQHIKRRYDDGANFNLYTLRLILLDILNDPALPLTYLVIDALDECDEGLQYLLDVITDQRFLVQSNMKWLVASRSRPDIAERLRPDDAQIKISLEMNHEHISRAVNTFIDLKVGKLAREKQYNLVLQEEVRNTLVQRCEATFLWVALACKRLEREPAFKARSVLKELPQGLNSLYERMMKLILRQPDDLKELCKQILRLAAVAYRPLRLEELTGIAELPDPILEDMQYLRDLVERCGSFLTLRNDIIIFIHQSAKDYVVSGKGQADLHFNLAVEHGQVIRQSLSILQTALKQDICDLKTPGILRSEVVEEVVRRALYRIEYACCYWVYHLSDYFMQANKAILDKAILCDGGIVHRFLQEHLLHWLEALSLLQKMSESILMAQQLVSVIPVSMAIKKKIRTIDSRH
jgi:NACHT domain